MNMVKPGIQTRRRKPKSSNGTNSNNSAKSKHNKHLTNSNSVSSGNTTSGLVKEHLPCTSESNLDYNLGTRKSSVEL